MTSTVKRLDPTQVELEIAIPREQVEKAQERAFRELVRNVRIPGFRPGKAPRKIFEAQYGSEIISERAMEKVVPDAYSQALRDNKLEPVDQPQVEMLPEEEEGTVRLRATVSVRPDITPHDYKGLEVQKPSSTISDEAVEQALESLRRESATLVDVERPVELGDVPTLDYEGSIDGVPFEGGKAERTPTEVVEGRFIPGFAQGLVGMRAGERKQIAARFPDDYAAKPELAGKDAVFDVTVHQVQTTELPPLDDEFAERFAPDGDLAKLRADIRRRLEANAEDRARRTMTAALMDRLLAAHDFPLPEVMVERESQALADELKTYVVRSGLTWEDYLARQERTEESVRAEYRAEAERRVKSTLLLEAIAAAENIHAGKADIEAEIASLARQYGQPREAVLRMLQPNFGALVDGIVRAKTLDFLLGAAKVIDLPAAPAGAEPGPKAPGEAGTGATNPAAP